MGPLPPAAPGAPAGPQPGGGQPVPAGPATATSAPADQAGGRKVARFIPAEAAQSSLKLADDGSLPHLQLREGQATKGSPQSGSESNPFLMFVVLGISVLASTFLLLSDFDAQPASVQEQKLNARWRIEEEYFANLNSAEPLSDYQVLLREAQQAHSRGDHETERRKYREVLNMLREERRPFERGLTGSRRRDKELESLITVLLSGR
jgi:hypothetical protein